MKSSIKRVAKNCGQDIPLKWDWPNFKMAGLQTYSPSSYCGEALSAVANVCSESADGKGAVVKSIKTIECKANSPRSISLQDGTLSFGTKWAAPNNQDAVRQFRLDNL